jgi:hypothetical protein
MACEPNLHETHVYTDRMQRMRRSPRHNSHDSLGGPAPARCAWPTVHICLPDAARWRVAVPSLDCLLGGNHVPNAGPTSFHSVCFEQGMRHRRSRTPAGDLKLPEGSACTQHPFRKLCVATGVGGKQPVRQVASGRPPTSPPTGPPRGTLKNAFGWVCC